MFLMIDGTQSVKEPQWLLCSLHSYVAYDACRSVWHLTNIIKLQKPDTYPAFLVDGKPPHPPLSVLSLISEAVRLPRLCLRSFCIAVAGFKPPGPTSDALFLPSYSTQTLHVLGKNDVIVVEERSKTLLDVSSNKRVEWHDGGV